MTKKQTYVYILSNATNVAVYVGVTSNLKRRVLEHKTKSTPGFAERYGIDKLVYYEVADDPYSAISREKTLKGSSRARKNGLVESMNPDWRDLYDDI